MQDRCGQQLERASRVSGPTRDCRALRACPAKCAVDIIASVWMWRGVTVSQPAVGRKASVCSPEMTLQVDVAVRRWLSGCCSPSKAWLGSVH